MNRSFSVFWVFFWLRLRRFTEFQGFLGAALVSKSLYNVGQTSFLGNLGFWVFWVFSGCLGTALVNNSCTMIVVATMLFVFLRFLAVSLWELCAKGFRDF